MKQREKIATEVEATRDEWYGFFPALPPEFDYEILDRWLSDTFGFRIDRLSADYYRRALTMMADRIRDLGGDL